MGSMGSQCQVLESQIQVPSVIPIGAVKFHNFDAGTIMVPWIKSENLPVNSFCVLLGIIAIHHDAEIESLRIVW